MANRANEDAAPPGGAPAKGYGKIDTNKEQDIMTDVGRSKGEGNNSADFGNDGEKAREVNRRADESRRDASQKSSSADDLPLDRELKSQADGKPVEPPRKYPS
jgi:hypothetical protein